MAKYTIMLGRPMVDGTCRHEVGVFVEEALQWAANKEDDRLLDIIRAPIQRYPASVARNVLVKTAQEQKAKGQEIDFLCMIDSDMRVPFEFLPFAFDFLIKHNGPAVIGVPYCTGGPEETCTVSEWYSKRSGHSCHAEVRAVDRMDAARRTGVEKIANMGCGCVLYSMSAFDKVKPPYFAYGYNEDHTAVIETEDCWCHRRMHFAGVPIYCAWDFWSMHWKGHWVPRPIKVTDENVENVFLNQARAELRMKPPPDDATNKTGENRLELVHQNGD